MIRYAFSVVTIAVDRVRAVDHSEVVLRAIAAAIAVLFLTTTVLERYDLYYSNQNTYFPAGLRLSGREFLQHDWFAQTRPPHIAFTYLVAGLDRLHILTSGMNVLETLLEAALLLAIWLIVSGIYRQIDRNDAAPAIDGSRLALTTVTFGLLLLGMLNRSFLSERLDAWHSGDVHDLGQIWAWTFSLGGLATQYLWGRYPQPSEFGILMLLAIGVMLFDRWRLGALLLGLAAVMHTGYLPHAGLLALMAAGWLLQTGRRRVAVESLLIFGVAVLPIAVYAFTFASQPGSAGAYDILANFRTPHHSVPAEWWTNSSTVQVGLMAVASLLVLWRRPGFLGLVLVTGFAYTILSILLVWFVVDSDALAFSHPWRGSSYLVPLSLFVVVAFAVAGVARLLQSVGGRRLPLGWFAVGASVLLLLGTVVQVRDAEDHSGVGSRWRISVMVREHTAPDDVIMVPYAWFDFRMEAERPIYVDLKSHPYLASEVLEWHRRFEISRQFYKLPESERGTICVEEGIDYYVAPMDVPVTTHRLIAETQDHRLVACPGPGSS